VISPPSNNLSQLIPLSLFQKFQLNYQSKLRSLLKLNSIQQKKIIQLEKEQKDNYRVKMIKSLRQQLREAITINEMLLTKLYDFGIKSDQINSMYGDILSKFKLCRPSQPIQLKKELIQKDQQIKHLKQENEQIKQNSIITHTNKRASNDYKSDFKTNDQILLDSIYSQNNFKNSNEIDELKLKLSECQQSILVHQQMIEQQKTELKYLKSLENSFQEIKRDKSDLESEHKLLKLEVSKLQSKLLEFQDENNELKNDLSRIYYNNQRNTKDSIHQ